MLFMQFKLGPDMALCLIKSILFALLAAFIVMPGLLMLFGPLIDRTQHRSFVPKIPFVGKLDFATRYIIPIVESTSSYWPSSSKMADSLS